MKRRATTYTFDASEKTINCALFTSLEGIQLIVNVTDNIIIYNFADPTKGGSLVSTILTLAYDTSTMSDTDKLMILLEDGGAAIAVSGTVDVTGVATETTLNDIKTSVQLSDDTVGTLGQAIPGKGVLQGLTDGTNMVAQRAIAHGQNVTTNVAAAGIMAELDDTSPAAVSENQFAPLRMSSRREMYVTIRDSAGNERGLNIDANGNISAVNAAGTNAIGKLLPEDVDVTTHTNYVRKYYTSAGAATDGIIWSPAAGKRWHVVDLYIQISADATITIEDDKAAGDDAVLKGEYKAGSGLIMHFDPKYPLASGEDAADLMITTSAGNVYVTVVGYEI